MDSTDSTKSAEEVVKVEGKVEVKEEIEPICLLFPTYATKTPNGQSSNEWKIRIRGWAFSEPSKSKTRSIFLGLTSLAIKKDDERYKYLERRTSYFWTNNADQGEFTVQAEGLTDPNKMVIEGDPNDAQPLTKEKSVTGTSASFNVPDVNKVFDQAGKIFQSGAEAIRATISPKSGHFFGDMSIGKDTVVKWINNNNSSTTVVKDKDKDTARLLKIKVYRDGIEPHFGIVNLIEPDGVSIISDIDDTIKDTKILSGAKKVLSNTFLQPFKDVPGMAEVYSNFYNKGAAIHYVSNSPWQLFPSLRTFFDTYNFPPGSAHFKFYDGLIKSAYEQKENPMGSKFKYIRELLTDFPNRQFILIGDTGELDPEIYTTVARENPGRILRIYVRDVTTEYIKDLPPEKAKHSYTKTFPTIYNYLRNHYSSEENEETCESLGGMEGKTVESVQVTTEQAEKATTSREVTTDATKSNRLRDKLHADMSYLYGTAMPDSSDSSSSTTNKPKVPLSTRLFSPDRAASISSKLSKLRSSSVDSDKKKDEDSLTPVDDDKEELKTPLEMFKERLQLLNQGLPDGLFNTFTDAKEIENDPVIRKALKYPG